MLRCNTVIAEVYLPQDGNTVETSENVCPVASPVGDNILQAAVLQDRTDLESRCLDSDPPNMPPMQHGDAVETSIGTNVPVQENDATYERHVASCNSRRKQQLQQLCWNQQGGYLNNRCALKPSLTCLEAEQHLQNVSLPRAVSSCVKVCAQVTNGVGSSSVGSALLSSPFNTESTPRQQCPGVGFPAGPAAAAQPPLAPEEWH